MQQPSLFLLDSFRFNQTYREMDALRLCSGAPAPKPPGKVLPQAIRQADKRSVAPSSLLLPQFKHRCDSFYSFLFYLMVFKNTDLFIFIYLWLSGQLRSIAISRSELQLSDGAAKLAMKMTIGGLNILVTDSYLVENMIPFFNFSAKA